MSGASHSAASHLHQVARARARETLAMSAHFRGLPQSDQFSTYRSLVDDHYRSLARQAGLSGAMVEKASDLIDDKRLENRRIEQAGDLAGDFVRQVDFPGFVRDLLKGVFDANLEVTLRQMDKYIELMKAATASVSRFINAIKDADAFGRLAESGEDGLTLDFDDADPDETGQPRAVLKDKDGTEVARAGQADIGDNEVKAKIMDAKIEMAKEQRALLRETILMGISRLVVERGQVKAAVVFDFKAGEVINKRDKAMRSQQNSSSSGGNFSSGLLGSLFGGVGGGATSSERSAEISVSSANAINNTNLAAKLTGSVDIVFKSDYFKLDNFAEMYGQLRQDAAAAAPAGPAAAPGAPAAPRPALPAGPAR